MRPTLRSVLASPAMAAGRPEVLAGASRLDTRVRWVHVSEVRGVRDLLRGGELILTTGLAMSGSPEAAVAYLGDLVAAGACGLVVELGDTLPRVPGEVLAAAEEAGFPLVVLHARVRFVEVTEEVHRGIVAEQLDQVEFSREVHETFTRLSLESAEASEIVATAARLCGASVVLEDLGRRVLAHAAEGRPSAGLLADWERRSRQAPALDATGLTGPEGWLTTPVGGRSTRWARLVVPDTRSAQARLAMVLERAAQALELGRMVERDRLSLTRQAQGGLLADLAAGRVPDAATARERAVSLGLAPAPRYVAAAVRPRTAGGFRGPVDAVAEHDLSRALVERVAAAAGRAGVSALVGALPAAPGPLPAGSAGSPRVGLLLAVPRAGQGADRAEERVLTALADAVAGEGLLVGVGPAAADVLAAGHGLRTALHVAEVAASMPPERARPFFRTSDIRLYGLVAQLDDDPRVQAFVESELAAVLRHPAADQLLETLRRYVEAGGNKTRMSALAHRSRAAVYKQLERLEKVLGVDLDDPVSLMSLGFAVLAHDHRRSAERMGQAPSARA